MSAALKHRNRPRRGVTLVEMLVVVALVVLMMVILVQIFQSALGAMSASRTTQELDVVLRSIDSMIRSDLAGVTAKMTPPNNPALKQGYFVYGENAPADLQGEDTDDYLAFTTKAPEGQVFTGRQWLSSLVSKNNPPQINQTIQPATVKSQVAEVIYFVRNGNLYRRVFLVAPERQPSFSTTYNQLQAANNYPNPPAAYFTTSIFGTPLLVSWQGMNDLSARPGGFSASGHYLPPILNDLGDLTNRENRAFSPRFFNDFTGSVLLNNTTPDGIPDDSNLDGIPDYYPTLYFDGAGWSPTGNQFNFAPNRFVNENIANLPYGPPNNNPNFQRVAPAASGNSWDVYAFPFIYPGMYSVPDPNRVANGLGWVHYMPPNGTTGYLDHSPLDLGETPGFAPGGVQTWWGFPTWRESMVGSSTAGTTGWTDPIRFVGIGQQQPLGLKPFNPAVAPSLTSGTFLPPVTNYGTNATPYGFDTAGSANFFPLNANGLTPPLWQDDLILTNVRSFDVKAYDPSAPLYNASVGTYLSAGYWDLGYAGLSPVTYAPNYSNNSTIWGPYGSAGAGANSVAPLWQPLNSEPQGFGHEGRIPPLPTDYRLDPRRGYNIGDPHPGVIRLTHTFDTWSTDYTNAPSSDILLGGYSAASPAIYPAFPAPYPSPLRGIQIQIRVTDPRNERTKVLTIRHDFTDKL